MITLLFIFACVVIVINIITINYLISERNYWKRKACLLKSSGKYGGILEAERFFDRERHAIEVAAKKKGGYNAKSRAV